MTLPEAKLACSTIGKCIGVVKMRSDKWKDRDIFRLCTVIQLIHNNDPGKVVKKKQGHGKKTFT